jgi:hypothetical protein
MTRGIHAAVNNQLRIPSLTPSHKNFLCVFNDLQHRVISTIELSNDEFCSAAAIAWRQLF